jgi:hypothetical protein
MRVSFEELQDTINEHRENISKVTEEMTLTDNEQELVRLVLALDFYEEALLVAEEVMADTIDKGRGD